MLLFRRNVSLLMAFYTNAICFSACNASGKIATTPAAQPPVAAKAVVLFTPQIAPPDTLVLGYGNSAELAKIDTVGTKPLYIQAHLAAINAALRAKTAWLPALDAIQHEAVTIALANPNISRYLTTAQGNGLRCEVFGVYPARESDFRTDTKTVFQQGSCYRVELYNYAFNATVVAIVSLPNKAVVNILQLAHTQPDIPKDLRLLALQIACDAPEVQRALGYRPSPEQALMPDTKTALNRSRCERSQHLCVAPTFVKGDKALWAIVDMTDLRLVGVRWTNIGTTGPAAPVSQRSLEYEKLTDCFCKKELPLARNDWQLNYMITSSDGLRISDIRYKNKLVMLNAKLVDWHVSYSKTDGFGYSDAIGCPYFSTATVLAVEPPAINDLYESGKKVGFVLEQGFHSEGWPTPCNYNYVQRYEFYDDGRLRVATASVGRGCGNDGTYRPVFRIALPQNDNSFAEWTGNDWKTWQKEGWQLQTELSPVTKDLFQYKIADKTNEGFYIAPARGQFADKGRGDNAFVFVTKSHIDLDEGDADLVTIGPCCNTDYHQGPEKFIEPQPEPIANESLVLWYVPQLKNDDTAGNEYCWAQSYLKNGVVSTRTYPCFGGPMFVPIRK